MDNLLEDAYTGKPTFSGFMYDRHHSPKSERRMRSSNGPTVVLCLDTQFVLPRRASEDCLASRLSTRALFFAPQLLPVCFESEDSDAQ